MAGLYDNVNLNVSRGSGLSDLIGGLSAGQRLGTGLIEGLMRNEQYKAAQQANQQAMAFQNAQKAFQAAGGGQQGIEAASAISPQAGMQLEDRQMKKSFQAIGLHDAMKASAYGNLDYYKNEYRPALIKMGVPPAMLPDYETVEDLNMGLYRNEIMAQRFKMSAQQPKVVAPGGAMVSPQGQVLYQAPQDPMKQQLMQSQIAKNQALASKEPSSDLAHIKRYVNEDTGEVRTMKINDPELNKKDWKEYKGDELDLTPDAINAMADRYLIDGTMPGLGLGKAATLARSKVMNRVAEKMVSEGITPQDAVASKATLSGLRSELNRTMGQRGPMLAFAKTADKNLDIALDLSNKVSRTGVPVFNRWLNAGRKSIAGDPDVAAFHAATQVAINEFAKVTSSATGGGVTSDTARKEIEEVLNTAQTPEQFKAVVSTLRSDMGNRISGYEDSIKRTKEALNKLGGGTTSASTKALSREQQDAINQIRGMGLSPEDEAKFIRQIEERK